MTERLVEMRQLLKPTGSIYLHCDPTASHYIKVVMDGIFGQKNFRNEIVWYYPNKIPDKRKKLFTRSTDTLLFYSKNTGSNLYFKVQMEERDKPVKDRRIKKVNGKKVTVRDEDGNVIYDLYTHRTVDNVWRIPMLTGRNKERLGYPTQKPLALLDRIIKASCPEDGVVLDPFCGCGTTIISAEQNKRKWIGMDICMLAVNSMEDRLKGLFPNLERGKNYIIDGLPTTVEQAITLATSSNATKNEGRYQFQYWAIEKVGGFASSKKSGDGGIDGSIYFYKNIEGKELGKMIISVKSDKDLKISYVRDLVGTLSNSKNAEMAGLICIDEPTDGMKVEALKAGFYEADFGVMGKQTFQKVQILTIKNIIENDAKFQTPFKVQKKIAQHSETKQLWSGGIVQGKLLYQ